MKRIDGVESVDVSLKDGAATVKLKPGNHVTVDEVRDAIRKNGFTPKAADATIAGNIIERNGQPALAVTGNDVVYLLTDAQDARRRIAELRKLTGKDAVVKAHIRESQGGSNPQTIDVRDFSAATR